MKREFKKVGLGGALIVFLIVAAVMAVGLAIIKLNTMVTFLLALIAVCICAVVMGMKLDVLQETILDGCKKCSLVIMIMISVGMVVGSWMISGIVPSIIYYGLKLFTPASFLAVGFVICCIVSFFTGSSYAALGTMGVAFMAIGYGMGINPALVAGMSVSGAVFGDKMSPFSDTTNMAPAAAGTDVFKHIKSMLWTVVPAFVISLILYFIMGLRYSSATAESVQSIQAIMDVLKETFTISPLLILVPIITVVLVALKVPAMIALIIGALLGVIVGLIAQPQYTFVQIVTAMASGFKGEFENGDVARLLNRGGISSMLSTVVYCILALELGEVMMRMGVLNAILAKIKGFIERPANLILSTLLTCLATVLLTTSQYMAILLPGEVFTDSFKKAKVAPWILSRTLEDGGTIFAFLVPWSAAAIYTVGVLNVSALEYLPYAFLCLLCPLFAIIWAYTGIGVQDIDGKPMRGKTLHRVEMYTEEGEEK